MIQRRSPCADCEHLARDKNNRRCADCRRRLAYINSLEPAPQCRQDPIYAMSYTVNIRSSLMPHAGAISSWDLIPN